MATRRASLESARMIVAEYAARFPRKTLLLFNKRLIIIGLLFMTALGIRLYHINEPPFNFHATRQYRSLLIARGYYFEAENSVPEWKRQVANTSKQRQGILEPPIMEYVVSIGYRIVGAEYFWIPQLLSSLFWLIGGGFLYMIARKIANADAALFATVFYLFLPFAVLASRSFQPDPAMVMMLLISIFAIVRYYEQPSAYGLIVAAIISALAFLIKPSCLFVIAGAFISLGISRRGLRRLVIHSEVLIFIGITLLPTIIVYIYGILTGVFLLGEAQKTVLPQLLVSPFFWRGWLGNIGNVIGFTALIGGLLGTLMFREGSPRALMIGLWSGYFVFGLALNYNVATHDYYQLQLVPIVALALGPIAALIVTYLMQMYAQLHWRVVIGSILLLALLLSLGAARARLISPDFEHTVKIEEDIGERVHHSTNTIFLAGDYGVPLEYHGLLSGSPWPLASDLEWERLTGLPETTAQERFDTLFAKNAPEYFIVMDMRELQQQPDLEIFLTKNYSLIAQTDDYLIFDLRRK